MMPATASMAWFWQAWLAAIVFIFPIPHTIALRNLVLLIGILALLWRCRQTLPQLVPWLRPAIVWLAVLTSWIIFHSVAVATNPKLALNQIQANWLMPLLIGGAAAWAATQLPRERAAQAVVLSLAAHMVWLLGWQFKLWLVADIWPFKKTPFGNYDFQGTLQSFFLAMLLADRLAWALKRYSPLALGQWLGWILLFLSIVSDIALQSRNSTAISLAMLLAASLILLNARSRHWRIIIVGVGLIALLGVGSVTFDSRWQNLRASAAFGWSQPNYWVTYGAATCRATPSGAAVDDSAYFRAAWVRQSIDFIAEHPMGIGFGHDAFGRAIEMKYGRSGMVSSHSGWLDFALGVGLPGLALLLLTAGLAVRGGWRQFRQHDGAAGLMFSFLVGSYLLRCLLDGHLSGWRLGLFAFLCGVLVAAMKDPRQKT